MICKESFYVPDKPVQFHYGLVLAIVGKRKLAIPFNKIAHGPESAFNKITFEFLGNNVCVIELPMHKINGYVYPRKLNVVEDGDTLAIVWYGNIASDLSKGDKSIELSSIDQRMKNHGLHTAIKYMKEGIADFYNNEIISYQRERDHSHLTFKDSIRALQQVFLWQGFDMFDKGSSYHPDYSIIYKAFYKACLEYNKGSEAEWAIPAPIDLTLSTYVKILTRISMTY